MLPDFVFLFSFPVQQTTSRIGHRVSSSLGLANNTLNVRNNNSSPDLQPSRQEANLAP